MRAHLASPFVIPDGSATLQGIFIGREAAWPQTLTNLTRGDIGQLTGKTPVVVEMVDHRYKCRVLGQFGGLHIGFGSGKVDRQIAITFDRKGVVRPNNRHLIVLVGIFGRQRRAVAHLVFDNRRYRHTVVELKIAV